MYYSNPLVFFAVPVLVLSALLAIWGGRLLRPHNVSLFFILVLLNIGVFAWMAMSDTFTPRMNEMKSRHWDEQQIYALLGFAICVVADLTALLAAKIYRAVVMDIATDAERQPGMAGVQAWLSINNVSAVVILAIVASLAFDYGFFSVAILGLAALLAYPLIRTATQPANSAAPNKPAPQPPSEERQRVLALVESGKISAEDGAELLSALAQSQAAGGEAWTLSGPRKIMAFGAAAMLVAFLLPWFTVNISQAMNTLSNGLQQTFQQSMPNMTPNMMSSINSPNGAPQFTLPSGVVIQQPNMSSTPVPTQSAMQISVRGGDIRDGLGWIALAAAIIAAALPFFWSPRGDERLMRNVTLALLAVGSVTMLYLLSAGFNAITSIEPGFILALAGYTLLWFGAIRELLADRAIIRQAVMA